MPTAEMDGTLQCRARAQRKRVPIGKLGEGRREAWPRNQSQLILHLGPSPIAIEASLWSCSGLFGNHCKHLRPPRAAFEAMAGAPPCLPGRPEVAAWLVLRRFTSRWSPEEAGSPGGPRPFSDIPASISREEGAAVLHELLTDIRGHEDNGGAGRAPSY